MTGGSRLRAGAWVLGVALLAGTLMGANRLLSQPTPALAGGPAPLAGGVIVLGTADSDPPPVAVGPPAVAAVATVEKVLVIDGQEVKAGDPLVQFDDRMAKTKLAQAEAELAIAEGDVTRAAAGVQVYALDRDRQRNAAKAADDALRVAEDSFRASGELIDKRTKAGGQISAVTLDRPLTEPERQQARREDPEYRRGEIEVIKLRAQAADEAIKVRQLDLKPVAVEAEQAAHKVDRLKATVAEARTAVELCLVRAKLAGTCEQVVAGPGQTFGPATRGPLLVLVPGGRRVVRAEVEAEFAPRVVGKVGSKVTVYDHSNPNLMYDGVVRQVGAAFLPKRSAGDVVAVAPARVLECVIDVPDPAPGGRPPLRVGQPVRVGFPDK